MSDGWRNSSATSDSGSFLKFFFASFQFFFSPLFGGLVASRNVDIVLYIKLAALYYCISGDLGVLRIEIKVLIASRGLMGVGLFFVISV